jgi:uncharacterized protein HemY
MKALTPEQKLGRLKTTLERQARMIRRENAVNVKLMDRLEKADARVAALEVIISGLKKLPGVNETLDAMKEQA